MATTLSAKCYPGTQTRSSALAGVPIRALELPPQPADPTLAKPPLELGSKQSPLRLRPCEDHQAAEPDRFLYLENHRHGGPVSGDDGACPLAYPGHDCRGIPAQLAQRDLLSPLRWRLDHQHPPEWLVAGHLPSPARLATIALTQRAATRLRNGPAISLPPPTPAGCPSRTPADRPGAPPWTPELWGQFKIVRTNRWFLDGVMARLRRSRTGTDCARNVPAVRRAADGPRVERFRGTGRLDGTAGRGPGASVAGWISASLRCRHGFRPRFADGTRGVKRADQTCRGIDSRT